MPLQACEVRGWLFVLGKTIASHIGGFMSGAATAVRVEAPWKEPRINSLPF
jgi:hypothetical protein